MSNHLALEGLLIDRLKAANIPGVREVYSVGEMDRLDENSFKTPCLAVQYDGEEVGDGMPKMGLLKVTQSWLVVVSTNSKRDPISGSGNRDIAGEILAAVIESMKGAKLGESMWEVRRVTGPKPIYRSPFASFPLRFEVSFMGG